MSINPKFLSKLWNKRKEKKKEQLFFMGFGMDLGLFKRDIDELIDEFAAGESVSFAYMKRVWVSKKFSYICEARPSCNSLALFMQTLYSHSIRYMITPDSSLSRRLGGLYCLYCLYETQPFKPPFKVYISLEELKKLRKLVVDAKVRDLNVVSALVKRMLEKNAFLFGFVETNEGLKGKVDELTELENARIQAACKKLFADTRIEEFIHMDLGMEVDLSKLKQMSRDYAQLKKIAAMEDGDEEMKGGSKDKELVGDAMEKISREWDAQREVFYAQTGLIQKLNEEEQQQQEEEFGDDESFNKELEQMLSET